MIITCPSCSARYIVNPIDVGKNGRKVKCTKCNTTWPQMFTPREQTQVVTVYPPATSSPKPSQRDNIQTPHDQIAVPTREPGDTLPAKYQGNTDRENKHNVKAGSDCGANLPSQPDLGSPPTQRDPSTLPMRSKHLALRMAWLILVSIIGTTIGGAVAFQQSITASWPVTKKFYEVVGLSPAPIDQGLVIKDLQYAYSSPEMLKVNGKLANITRARQEVPSMRARLFDRLGIVVMDWKFFLSKTEILSNEVIKFSTEIRNPPVSAERIDVGINNH